MPIANTLPPTVWGDHVVCEHNGHGDDLLLRIVITERYKYVAAVFDGDELYDLRKDPHELHNLAGSADHADICRQMRQRLIEHIVKTNDRVASNRLLYVLREGK